MSEDNTRRKREYPSKMAQSSASEAKDQWWPWFTFIWRYFNGVPQSIALIKYNRKTSDIVLPDLEFKPNNVSTNVLFSMFGSLEYNETCQKCFIKLAPLETYVSPLKYTTTLRVVDKKAASSICDSDNLLMKIKLSYPIKEVVRINGGFGDLDLTSDGSIITVNGKSYRNEIYRLNGRGKKFEKFNNIFSFANFYSRYKFREYFSWCCRIS